MTHHDMIVDVSDTPVKRVANDLTEDEFIAWYGPWDPPHPSELPAMFPGSTLRWWVAGGWAIELWTGVPRDHDDLDVAIVNTDIPILRGVQPHLHLWEAHLGTLTPLLPGNELTPGREQLWARRSATDPWILDILLSPVDGDDWVFKRDQAIRMPLTNALRCIDGIPVLAPHIVMLYKARLNRPKDQADFDTILPHLDEDARRWLADSLSRHLGTHEWIPRLV